MLTEAEIKAYTVDIPNDIQAAQRASGCAPEACSAIPTEADKTLGWKVDFQLLGSIADEVNSKEDNNLGLEELDDAIRVLCKLGFCKFAGPPNAEVSGASDASGSAIG